ncbi:TatD family hydrolase [Niabella insulamsoli]|uniref:TatD family hydrolase n=1 Tax=Niabella insulamsoli TaxID=3144874 RepID=UPI0031FCD2A4
MFIDTHAHVYSEQFLADNEASIQRAAAARVEVILMPAIDSQTHEAMLRCEREGPVTCKSMMGLHPCSVTADFEKELAVAEKYFQSRKFVAVGETGLDFYWDTTFKDQQLAAFNQQMEWAIQYDIPVVIHSRNATAVCIEAVAKKIDRGLKGVFHCFGGSWEEAAEIIKLGFYLGIGGVLTFKKSGLEEVIKKTGLENIVLETDAPYLAPVPYRGKRNEPAYLPLVAHKLAEAASLSVEAVADITTANAKKLFGL